MGTNLDIVRQHYAHVAEGHLDRDREIMSASVMTSDPGAGEIAGIDAFLAFEASFHVAFPDGRMELHGAVESGSTVATHGVFKGTHTGPLAGSGGVIEPTNHSLALPFADFFRFEGGKIVEHSMYYDQMSFLGQLGLLPG